MSKCIIITAYNEYPVRESVRIEKGDYVICADGGYQYAEKDGVIPKVIIGDFDSIDGSINLSSNHLINVVCLPTEKDDTDTMFCLKYGIEKGFNDFVIVGGFGGRLDHTYANIQTLAYGCLKGKKVVMQDKKHMLFMLSNGSITVEGKQNALLSVFAYTDICRNVTLEGVKYILLNADLTNNFPLGVSNEILSDKAVITCGEGILLVMISQC